MQNKMLIDATHAEETRVAIVADDNRLEDFDFESAVKKQLKGNIFLVKVSRVEPSLQAAFVDFGGNRHGFLPFPEIHPDYYRIPIADREALLQEQAAEADAEIEPDEDSTDSEVTADDDVNDSGDETPESDTDEESDSENGDAVETIDNDDSDEDIVEDIRPKRPPSRQHYKIQEVIKRGQIMLIQINKEERGTKGAAVTTYISLPGRYCVLMPNSPRGGGVSRKVGNPKDRQKLKKILTSLEVPDGMSVILRTAGMSRTKTEIKRDLDYLLRLWNGIRELTLQSTAPALVYEEGNIIKRAIRDLYKRDIDEIHVAGEEGYRVAKDFMKTLIPSHAKRVQLYKDDSIPLFFKYDVEGQIDEIHNATVHMRSGGYIVINPTEALISIDVNSGRATKERHIEETALKTNLEAAEEIARQLRLRDLGGLIVIDFIDMEDSRNNRAVERRLKEAMEDDRARIQIGRISTFGLLELSRQRLRASLIETQFETCTHCQGIGLVRSVEATAVMVLRGVEEEGIKGQKGNVIAAVPSKVSLYLLNQKRADLSIIEERYGLQVEILADENLAQSEFILKTPDGKILCRKGGHESIEDNRKPPVRNQENRSKRSSSDRMRRKHKSDRSEKEKVKETESRNKDTDSSDENSEEQREKRSRRRGRRGGRRRNRRNNENRNPSQESGSQEGRPNESTAPANAPATQNSQSGSRRPDNGNKPPGSEKEAVSIKAAQSPGPTPGDSGSGAQSKKRGWWRRITE